jgi:hypothetical protein
MRKIHLRQLTICRLFYLRVTGLEIWGIRILCLLDEASEGAESPYGWRWYLQDGQLQAIENGSDSLSYL